MGGVSVPYREGKTGSCPPTLSPPVLPWVCTYLTGPRARRGHHPRSSFQISGRVPRRPAAALQEPGSAPTPDRPIARCRLRLHPIHARVAGDHLRVPPPGLQQPSDRDPGLGGVAARWLGSLGGKTHPVPHSYPAVEDSGLGVAWEGGNLNPVSSTYSGVEFPPTVFQVEKLRSRETSDYLQVTQNIGGMHSFNVYFNTRYGPRATLGPGIQW